MKLRKFTGILAASVVLIAAASGSTKTPSRAFRSHLVAPAGTSQKAKDSPFYEPPRSPGFNRPTRNVIRLKQACQNTFDLAGDQGSLPARGDEGAGL